ncbi:MAG: DRTGG domain-containing protein [Acidobacteriota bacterium]|jgi:hypothetical protein|nr:DRTGG domain-containing protein [Acidobacteriota bacterium]
MKLSQIIDGLGCDVLVQGRDVDVIDGYASDLLSDVMANCPEGAVWLTLQRHLNVIAVAQLKRIPAIVVTNNGRPDDAVLEKADEEGLTILTTAMDTFSAAGRIFRMFHSEP